MSGRGGGGGGGGRRRGGGRRSDSRPDHSSPAPDQSANRGGRGGRGRGYGSPDAGGSRPAPEFHAPANFPPLSSSSPSASTSAASLSREFDKSLTLQSPSSAPVRHQPSDPVRPQPQTPIPRQAQPQPQTFAPRPAQTHHTTPVPSQPQPQTPAPRPAQTHPTTPVPSQPQPQTPAPRPAQTHPTTPVPSQPQASASSSSSEQATEIEVPPSTSKAITFPRRPGFGTLGKKCTVRANHFQVEVEDRDYYHYDVTITPEVISKTLNRTIMSQLVELYKVSHLGQRNPAYDGSKSLYTAGPLPFNSKEFIVKLVKGEDEAGPRREREFKVAIKLAAKCDLYQLQQFLRGKQLNAPQEIIQILDVALRASPSANYTVVGRSFFSTRLGPKGVLPEGLEYWRGYYQSLRPTQMGLSLNIDVSARSFYEPILVTEFVAKHVKPQDVSKPMSDKERIMVRRALKGVKVQLTHREYVKRYKIADVSRQPTNQLTFTPDDEGPRISVAQYFRQKYNIVLKYANWPSLQAGSDTKPIYLPMEVCKIVEGQRYTKKLNESQVSVMLRATCQRPNVREENIVAMVKRNNFSQDKLLREDFGIRIKEEPTLVDARVLPPPRLKYHDSGREANVHPQVGQWNMIDKKMVNGGTVQFWTCLNFSYKLRNVETATTICNELVNMCVSKGMQFSANSLLPIRSVNPSQIEEALIGVHDQSKARLASMGQNGKQLQLLIIILPDQSGSYGKIKRICETELGIVSQCCKPSNLTRLSKQYFENVALKINVKVGGRNNVLSDAIQRRIPLVSDLPTIIFGADVTHPQPGEDSSPSIAAVVASMDWPEITKYRGLVSAQHHREEIIQDLYKTTVDPQRGVIHGGMIRELLIAFRRSTGYKPHRIIFYRDGVSEGQFNQVLLYEMDAIRKACASLEDGYLPPVTFVVVQKRHHTRFFPTDPRSRDLADRSGNVLPGTVVDTKICHPTEFDFYLNSHAGIQGTSRPTHYHVLFDENKFTADILQMLTNNLCYTYARCTRSVSIVPPAYYAHLAAFRARYYIEGDTSDVGSSSGTRDRNVEVRLLPAVKENVKDVMFYC